MKNLCLAFAFVFTLFHETAHAQWVPIDPYFADWISNNISPAAIDNTDPYFPTLDTTNIDIVSVTSVSMNAWRMSLEQLMYFDNLQVLDVHSIGTNAGIYFPPGLIAVRISGNLSSLPSLPQNLESLDVSNCPMLIEVIDIPASLTRLKASNSLIRNIGQLPTKMYSLILNNSGLQTLTNIPEQIDTLDLSYSPVYTPPLTGIFAYYYVNLDSCPNLNINDIVFYLRNDFDRGMHNTPAFSAKRNGLTAVPDFNCFLRSLDLSYNPIAQFATQPEFTNYHLQSSGRYALEYLEELYLDSCGLTSIDYHLFFEHVGWTRILHLSGNNLQQFNLDSIPFYDYYSTNLQLVLQRCNLFLLEGKQLNSQYVWLEQNNLSCIPDISSNVFSLRLANNSVSCVSRIPTQCDVPLSVCANSCADWPRVNGIVFNDMDANGIMDSTELPSPNVLVKLNPFGKIQKTDSTGRFDFGMPPGGPYTLVPYSQVLYDSVTTSLNNRTIQAINSGQIDSSRNIGLYRPDNINDISIKITPLSDPRPGFYLTYNITVSNFGTTIQNGTASLQFDPSLIFQSASSAGVYAGDSITWTFSNLLPAATVQYDATFKVPATTPLGTSLCARAIANGNTPDTTIYNNRDSICQTVIGSYDPNDKTAYPGEVLTKEQMVSGEGIDYVVRFQNTGTASAINVRVEDTISPLMEAATIRMIASSHVNEWRIDSGNVLKVFFDNINLPDSGANELLSHGFFRYSIKPKAGTAIGDSIKNTALIYFDFNAPIVTNTVKTDVTTLFAIPIAPQTVCEGQPLNLNFTDNPAISKIEWLRNDTALGIYGASLNIPNATLAHNGQYSVRITLNNDAVFSSTKSTITVNPTFIPSVSIAQTTLNACAGDLVSFTATPNNGGTLPVYQWFINGALNFSGGDVLSVTLNRNDEVKAVMTSSLSCVTTPNDTSNVLLAAMDTLATTSISIVAPTGICEGQNAAIITISKNAGNAAVYQWNINGQVVQNANTATLNATLQNSDVVGVKLISSLQCVTEDTVSASQNITTTAAVVPTISLSASADNNICNGLSQSFKVSATNQGLTPMYTWYLNGTALSALTSDSVLLSNLSDGDIVYAVLQSSATCATPAQVSSLTDTVEVIPAPDKPTITQSGSTLTADALDGIQWLLNGTPVQGANSASYTAEVNGVYSVLVTDNNGCTALSDTIGMRILSLGSIDISQAISVYPNPFSSQVTLQLDADLSADSWSYKLLNVSGQTILQAGISQNITSLNMEQVASGVYMLHVQGANGNKAFRLVKY